MALTTTRWLLQSNKGIIIGGLGLAVARGEKERVASNNQINRDLARLSFTIILFRNIIMFSIIL